MFLKQPAPWPIQGDQEVHNKVETGLLFSPQQRGGAAVTHLKHKPLFPSVSLETVSDRMFFAIGRLFQHVYGN